MKRSHELTPLSKEHHQALVISHKLLKLGLEKNRELEAYWLSVRDGLAKELDLHFKEEEQWFGSVLKGVIAERFFEDHNVLRKLLLSENRDDIILFASRLKAHVRFEERELFNWLEMHYMGLLQKRCHP